MFDPLGFNRLCLSLLLVLVCLGFILMLTGCSSGTMSLTSAIQQAQASLAAARASALPGATMLACKATVTYQVGVSDSLSGKVGLKVPYLNSPAIVVGSSTGSTVSVEFDSPSCKTTNGQTSVTPTPGEQPVMAK